jgi:hypothetical protein
MTATLAWHNRPELKAEVVARMHAHRAADSIVQGIYQQIDPDVATGYSGCAIGCTLPPLPYTPEGYDPDNGWWQQVEEAYGIPWAVARLIDNTFEDQHEFEDAARFAVEVIEAIPVGADLSAIDDQWLADQMPEEYAESRADWLVDHLAVAPVPPTSRLNT